MTIEHPIVVRLDGTNAEEGRRHPRRGLAGQPARRADDARRGAARGGASGVTDVWSERAEAFRESAVHREGADLDLLVEWCEPGPGVQALDVATGGGHVARRLREAGCDVVSVDPAPGMQADVVAPRRGHPVRRRLVRRRRVPDRAAPLRRRPGGRREMARVSRRLRRRRGQPLHERGVRGGREAARPDARPLLHRGRVALVLRRRRARGRAARGVRARQDARAPGSRGPRLRRREAERVRELLADHIADGLLEFHTLVLKGRKR